jgi:hypothetical protein
VIPEEQVMASAVVVGTRECIPKELDLNIRR